MVTLVSIPNVDANSYCTVAFADEYFDYTVNQANWPDLSADDKARGLIHATMVLDSLVQWSDTTIEAISSEVPLNIKRATCELAVSILKSGGYNIENTQELDGLKVGPIELDFSGDYSSALPAMVAKFVEPFGTVLTPQTSRQVYTPKLVRT
mgnify:FL=1